jgi:glutaredoxin 3
MPPIVMYAKTTCPYCHAAERLLEQRGVTAFEKILIDEEPQRRPEMIERSGGRTTVPQIFIGDRHIGGCDDLMALDADGGLVPLLDAKG